MARTRSRVRRPPSAVRTVRAPRCTVGLEVQTLIFRKENFPRADRARSWARYHGFKVAKVDETEVSFRLRQREPSDFVPGSFRTIDMGSSGVRGVVGCPKRGRESDKSTRRDPPKRTRASCECPHSPHKAARR